MANDTTANAPDLALEKTDAGVRFILLGDWTLIASRRLEEKAQEIVTLGRDAKSVTVNLLSVTRLDTAGAWLINRARQELTQAGVSVTLEKARPEHRLLLEEAHPGVDHAPEPPNRSLIIDLLADLGRSIVTGFHQAYLGVAFLGEFMVAVAQIALRPQSFRLTSLVYHVESIGFRSIPIIVLVNFLVGGIVAQQGIFQLQRFGASSYAVDLIGILVLRELGVLLTSIMIAGRSGSAITAEIGSMMMREEIDALRVMGLSPLEVLIAPRVLALVISLPMLTFLGDMSALFGGLLVTWSYGGVSPPAFFSLLQEAIGLNTFMVGLIKAPFMALVIGLIAAMDGLATKGSAESLGRQVTGSVVKSIFMVIVVDGFFAIFFAGIHY